MYSFPVVVAGTEGFDVSFSVVVTGTEGLDVILPCCCGRN